MRSLRARLFVVASCVLAAFMLLCGEGLDQAFQKSAREIQRNKMQALVYALLGAAEAGENDELTIAEAGLPDPRFSQIGSGLEALIFNDRGIVVWRTPNFAGPVPQIRAPGIGATVFTDLDDRFVLAYGVRWVADNPTLHLFGGGAKPQRYTFAVLEDRDNYNDQLTVFRNTLWIGLGGSALALLLVQALVMSWGLSPLQRLAREVHRIEKGETTRIESSYPAELTPVVEGLNTMIHNERSQQTRYRNALGDLAHSLKTPLAVLRGLIESAPLQTAMRSQFEEPMRRLQDITDYQLKRASAAGRRTLSEPVAPLPIIEKTIAALSKVYVDKHIRFTNEVPERLRLRADSGDLYELFGNLLDNASKWCRSEVRIAIVTNSRRVQIDVDDDGAGFPADADKLLQRGVRADSLTPGQGIGLATVADIVSLNEGRIELLKAPIGGARVRVSWPI